MCLCDSVVSLQPPTMSSQPPLAFLRRSHVDTVGPAKVLDDMNRFADTVGDWFAPPQLLVDMVKAGKKFHN